MGAVSAIQYDHPNFPYAQYVAEEAARYEAAQKVTAAALATTPEERELTALDTKLIVLLYLDALRTSQEDRDAEADRLARIPYGGGAYYTNLVAPIKSTKKKAKVKRAKSDRRAKTGTRTTPKEQQGQQGPILPMKERLYLAFENLKAKVAGSEREFYGGVGYEFVLKIVSKRMLDAGECATTEQDITNHILWELSRRNLDEIKDVYKCLSSAAKKQGGKAFLDNLEDRETHEPVLVEREDEDGGDPYKEDNPAMHGDVRYRHGGKPVFQESRPHFPKVLPEFIQGDNLRICQYIREDYSYAKIAEVLCMSVAAVKQRVAWMKRQSEMRARGEKI
jgi:hypothetical protein